MIIHFHRTLSSPLIDFAYEPGIFVVRLFGLGIAFLWGEAR